MSILARDKAADAEAAYAPDFIAQVMELLPGSIAAKRIKAIDDSFTGCWAGSGSRAW